MPAFALTIFTSAFLLFLVQPLLGRFILPWYGGSPAVWTACMLFFQTLLVGGYLYAHLAAKNLTIRRQSTLHLVLVALALLWPVVPGDGWKPHGSSGNPAPQILLLLTACVGLPYFVLSATGPLMQHWFGKVFPGRTPYKLYALSNVGSLFALVSFPFVVEPQLTRRMQAQLWWWGLVVYGLLCLGTAALMWRNPQATSAGVIDEPNGPEAPPQVPADPGITGSVSLGTRILWVLFPAVASALLLGVTNKLCQDIAAVPFLWVAPLMLYLLSFIICFDRPRWYSRLTFTPLLIAAMVGFCWALYHGHDLSVPRQMALYGGGLFVCCMVCHGEVYRLRPGFDHLTLFYVLLASGGALGGIFVGLLAPSLFTDYYELHIALGACGLLFVVACATGSGGDEPVWTWRWLAALLPLLVFAGLDWHLWRLGREATSSAAKLLPWMRIAVWTSLVLLLGSWVWRGSFKKFRAWRFFTCLWLSLGVIGLVITLWLHAKSGRADLVQRSRNFYGVLSVYEYNQLQPDNHYLLLQHGRITHGLQLQSPESRDWLTTYYGETSGLGLAFQELSGGFRRVGLVGLGTGTSAAMGRAGDVFRFYEINPHVVQVASENFSFLRDAQAKTEVVLGDARLSMEREKPQHFDLLALDAFSSDSIPVHLLTREAFEVYLRHVNTNGVIAVHISNHYLDLRPVVGALAREFGLRMCLINDDKQADRWWLYDSTWALLSRDESFLGRPAIASAEEPPDFSPRKLILWTDDFAALFPILE